MHNVDRTRRVGELMRRELAILIREMDDQRVAMTSVTAVKVTRDLRRAIVYISAIRDADREALAEGLNLAAGHLRHQLSRTLDLRRTPSLHFIYDDTIEHGVELSRLIDSLLGKER